MTPREFLEHKYGMKTGANFAVCYRIVPYGSLIESYNVEDAVQKIERDIEEMRHTLACYDVDVKHAEQAVYDIWSKHLIVW